MANYYAQWRSNYFYVKDLESFTAWCARCRLDLWRNKDGTVGFGCGDNEGGLPSSYYDEATDDDIEIDFIAELVDHLQADQIAVVQEVGHEKLRYLVGWAIAVNAEGETTTVSIDDIYDRAESKWGIRPAPVAG